MRSKDLVTRSEHHDTMAASLAICAEYLDEIDDDVLDGTARDQLSAALASAVAVVRSSQRAIAAEKEQRAQQALISNDMSERELATRWS